MAQYMAMARHHRDSIYVVDHCRAIDTVPHHGQPGNVYNVRSGDELPNVDVVRRIANILKAPALGVQFVQDRRGHDRPYAVNDNKSRSLGYRPITPFRQEVGRHDPVVSRTPGMVEQNRGRSVSPRFSTALSGNTTGHKRCFYLRSKGRVGPTVKISKG